MKKVLSFVIAGLVVALSACSGTLDTTGSVKLENKTTQNVVLGLYLSSSSDWGANQLSSVLGTNESVTVSNIITGTYSFKVAVSNTFYYEVEAKADSTNTNVLTSYNISSGTVEALSTYTITLLPAWLSVSNNSTNKLYYLYLNEVGSFDLLNMVETNQPTGDIIAAGSVHAFGEELVAGTYSIVVISDNNITNIYSNVTLSANSTNTLNITNF